MVNNYANCGYLFCNVYQLERTEIMEEDWVKDLIDEEAKFHLNRSFQSLGLEGTVELIERLSAGKIKDIYMELLRQKGLVK